MPLTAVEICSAAMVKIGAAPIASLSGPGTETEVARMLYEPTVRALLASHPWGFAQAQAKLAEDASTFTADFSIAYQLPADLLRVISAGHGRRGRGLSYRIMGDKLLCNARPVTLTYLKRADEGLFPPHFAQALITRLAAEFCIPLTEGTSRAEAMGRLAQAELKLARLVDSQQMTPNRVEDFTLIAARGR